jgi:hypothetical protein
MDLRALAEWLSDTIAATGFQMYPEVRAKANFPCGMIGWPGPSEYDADFDGADTITIPVHLLASGNDDITARHTIDLLLSRGTDTSIKDILEAADPTGVADSIRVIGWDLLDGITVNDVPAYGVTLTVEVIG